MQLMSMVVKTIMVLRKRLAAHLYNYAPIQHMTRALSSQTSLAHPTCYCADISVFNRTMGGRSFVSFASKPLRRVTEAGAQHLISLGLFFSSFPHRFCPGGEHQSHPLIKVGGPAILPSALSRHGRALTRATVGRHRPLLAARAAGRCRMGAIDLHSR
jgi:hypothetical protein